MSPVAPFGRAARAALPLALLAVAAASPPAAAGEKDEAPAGPAAAESREEASGVRLDDGRRTIGRLPANLGRGLIGVFHGDNLAPLVAGSVATGAATFLDEEVRNAVVDQLDWSESFATAGGPIYSSIFVVGMFAAGRFADGGRFREMTYDMLDAATVNFTYTALLKAAVGRERPNGENNQSFPSGHTSNAFALATVAERHYGWKLGVPAYLLAGVMGASRLNEDKHWLSDVVAGATLGYIVGRTVVRVNSRPLERAVNGGTTWSVSPILGRHARGIHLSVMF